MQFIDAAGVALASMYLLFESTVVGCDELTRATTAFRIRAAGDAAIRTEAAKGG
jgi:hypothetical protein